MGCLYRLTSPSGKQYVGITIKSLDERWDTHLKQIKNGRQHALQMAIKKYGAENFIKEVLVIADDREYLLDLEVKAIKAFGTLSPAGYNLTTGGEGIRGINEESKQKMSRSMKATWARTKHRRLGHLQSMRDAKTIAMAKDGAEDARREKIAASMSEFCKQPEAKARLSAIAKIVWRDPERRAALLAKRQVIIDARKKAKNEG